MSRKDYNATAEAIRQNLKFYPESKPALRSIAQDMAGIFKRDNCRFDYSRFYDACGLEDG